MLKRLSRLPLIALAALTAVGATLAAGTLAAQTTQPWLHPDVQSAWTSGFTGLGVTISVVDDFNSASTYRGTVEGAASFGTHGYWTAAQAGIVAPGATVNRIDYGNRNTPVALAAGMNVVNLSYGILAHKSVRTAQVGWGAQDLSIITAAKTGAAVITKAAGNDGINIGAANRQGQIDQLNVSLTGATGAIFVGALTSHGTLQNKARLAAYSNKAGTNKTVQNQFLVVGVPAGQLGLQGTSFAAPVVAGYAAIVGQKFDTATPVQIRNQLLNTARRDTISGYNIAVHGRGEASLSRSLAPVAIR